jgi:hypothetical protein
MESKAVNRTESSAKQNPALELGVWLGRHQAWALVASRCSAADAHALRVIRDENLYRHVGLNWEQFCKQHAGCSYKTADRIINRFREFGESYFNLSQIVNIPESEYRALQPAIADNAIEFDGRRIAINRENTEQLIEAVHTLRARLEKSTEEAHDPLGALERALGRALGELSGALRRSEGAHKDLVLCMMDDHISRIYELAKSAGYTVIPLAPEAGQAGN